MILYSEIWGENEKPGTMMGTQTLLEMTTQEYVLSKGAFVSKTVATFVQKVALIWLKGGFSLQLFKTQM